jgi:predicted HicB family RNase H-like nuclease
MLVNKPNKPSFASLGAHLLARKGSAQPSIPPHPLAGTRGVDALEAKIIATLTQVQEVPSISDAPVGIDTPMAADAPTLKTVDTPQVSVKSAKASSKESNKEKLQEGQRIRKAAFTLRLDPERHLRLRLLSAYSNRSSQQLVLEALDRLLENNAALIGSAADLR